MRSGFILTLFVTLLFAGGYFYNLAQAVCPVPVTYRIGSVDERFGLTLDEAKVAVTEAAEIWEEATGQNLFTYDEEADFEINFIFDERQEFTDAEERFENRLESAADVNNAIGETYTKLVADYDALKLQYADRVAAYERRLDSYNETVREYNEQGGAPKDVYEELEVERQYLDEERSVLQDLDTQLNQLVAEINNISEKGNALVRDYNREVGIFNKEYGEPREFTQGDYNYERINIYTYKDEAELELVLAHELGHALSLGHVEGDSSVMYFLIGDQPAELSLTETDLGEFNRVCGDMNLWDKIVYRLSNN